MLAQSVLVGTGPLAAFCSAKRSIHGRLAFDVARCGIPVAICLRERAGMELVRPEPER